ncbi:MAG: Mur ligase domain-containing protein, partial [Chloroflexota bacterium]
MERAELSKLFAEFPFPFSPTEFPDIPISGIAIDSRLVQPGNLFVAMQGKSADGHDFISNAISRGAVAIVGEKQIDGLT